MGKPVLPDDYNENGDRGPVPYIAPLRDRRDSREARMFETQVRLEEEISMNQALRGMELMEDFQSWQVALERRAQTVREPIGPERQLPAPMLYYLTA